MHRRYCSPDESYRSKTDFCTGPIQVSNSQHEQYTVVRRAPPPAVAGGGRQCHHAVPFLPTVCTLYSAPHCAPIHPPPCLLALALARVAPCPPPQVTVQEPRPTPGFLLEVATALSGMNVQIYQGVVQGSGCEGDDAASAMPVVERQVCPAPSGGGWQAAGCCLRLQRMGHAARGVDALHMHWHLALHCRRIDPRPLPALASPGCSWMRAPLSKLTAAAAAGASSVSGCKTPGAASWTMEASQL